MKSGRERRQPKNDSKKGSRAIQAEKTTEKINMRRQKAKIQQKEAVRAAKKSKKKNGRKPRKMAVKHKNVAKQNP